MRIRLSGEVGGMVIVVIAGVIAASIIDGILSFIEKHVVKDNEGGKKNVFSHKKSQLDFLYTIYYS